jgi:hypothetical protein
VTAEKDSTEHKIDPEGKRIWQLARRDDLADAFGIVLRVPAHGRDDEGNWHYGREPFGGVPNQEFENAFFAEMQSIIDGSSHFLVSRGLLTAEQAEAIEGHPYSTGPAAQEWPQHFFEFYRDVQPIINNGASLIEWAAFFGALFKGFRFWTSRKQEEVVESLNGQLVPGISLPRISITPVLTRADVIALCYADMTKRYGIGEDVTVDAFSRSLPFYETLDHPGGSETYLVRIRAGGRKFHYLVDSKGQVIEHYLTTGSDLTLLELPNLVGAETGGLSRDPQPSQRLRIKAK